MALADAIRESMSTVIDGEGSELDVARVLKAVEENPEARAHWQRLQQQRHVLQTGRPVPTIDVSGGVRAALETQVSSRRRVGPLGSLAVAASVTFAVVFGGQQLASTDVTAPVNQLPGGVVSISGGVPVQARYGAAPVAQPQTRQADVAVRPAVSKVYEQLARERFERFGTEHAQSTAGIQPNALVPYARIPQREK